MSSEGGFVAVCIYVGLGRKRLVLCSGGFIRVVLTVKEIFICRVRRLNFYRRILSVVFFANIKVFWCTEEGVILRG